MNELALHLLRATQEAAHAALDWVGRGDPKASDAAAVAAMRSVLGEVPGQGTVVIGEGAKDEAPMLYEGEIVGCGNGDGPTFDLAVDPLENTKACARGAEGAVTTLAAAPSGTMLATPGWYMDKIVVGAGAAGVIDITAPLDHNLTAVARALERRIDELTAVVLDKPRHTELIETLCATGVRVALIPDGDVLGALRVLLPDGDADILLGIGGAPEGVLNACSARVLGGDMQGALAPQSAEERALLHEAGQTPGLPFTLDDLVASDDCCFVATGVTHSPLLSAPRQTPNGQVATSSVVATPQHPALIVESRALAPNGHTESEGHRA